MLLDPDDRAFHRGDVKLVPNELREASYALVSQSGDHRQHRAADSLLPESSPASCSVSPRVMGETAPLIILGSPPKSMASNLFDGLMGTPAHDDQPGPH